MGLFWIGSVHFMVNIKILLNFYVQKEIIYEQ